MIRAHTRKRWLNGQTKEPSGALAEGLFCQTGVGLAERQ